MVTPNSPSPKCWEKDASTHHQYNINASQWMLLAACLHSTRHSASAVLKSKKHELDLRYWLSESWPGGSIRISIILSFDVVRMARLAQPKPVGQYHVQSQQRDIAQQRHDSCIAALPCIYVRLKSYYQRLLFVFWFILEMDFKAT